jgi:hypothetical protein
VHSGVSRAKQDLRLWGHDVLINVFRGCKRLRAGLLSEDPALLGCPPPAAVRLTFKCLPDFDSCSIGQRRMGRDE